MNQIFKRRLISFLCVVLLAGVSVPARAKSPEALGDILKKTETYYQQIHAFTAYFRQTTSSAAAGAVSKTEASGKLYYQKPRQMRWEYEKPEPQVFAADHELAWLFSPVDKQISLFDAKNFFSSPLARTFFDGVVELKNHFTVTLDSKQSTGSAAVLKLVPKEEDPNIKTLFLWIDLQNYRIQTIETRDALGNINRITLDALQPTPRLDSKLFQLDVPPSTAVVDTDGRELTPAEIEAMKQKLSSKQD